MNLHILIGNVGSDPEIKTAQGTKFAKFSLATDASYTDRNGERVKGSDWHNISVAGKLADVVEKYVHKGDKIALEGMVKTRTYEKDGFKRYLTETKVTRLELLGSKPKENHGEEKPKEDFPEMPEGEVNDLPF